MHNFWSANTKLHECHYMAADLGLHKKYSESTLCPKNWVFYVEKIVLKLNGWSLTILTLEIPDWNTRDF